MKRLTLVILASLLIITSCGAAAPKPAASTDQVNFLKLAVSAADKLATEQFGDLYAMLAPDYQDTISADELKGAWKQIQAQLGDFQYYASDFSVSDVNSTMIADVPFTFANDTINVKISFNQKGEINGLYFDSAANGKISPRLPNDTEVIIGSEPWTVSGCLTLPEGRGPFPAVILVQGFGPSDRNAQIGPNLPFYDMAAQLSQHGIAVLRYDKRTYTYANEMLQEESDLTIEAEITDDVAAAFALLAASDAIYHQQIYVAGGDFSGMIMPLIAQRVPEARGFILMNTPAQPIPDLIDQQAQYLTSLEGALAEEHRAEFLQQAQALAQRFRTLTADSPLGPDELLGAPVSYWLPLLSLDTPQAMAELDKPLLLLQGGRDYQATAEDWAIWQETLSAHPDATFKLYSNLNHLFMTGVGKSRPAEYQTKGTVSEDVTGDIAAFIKEHGQ